MLMCHHFISQPSTCTTWLSSFVWQHIDFGHAISPKLIFNFRLLLTYKRNYYCLHWALMSDYEGAATELLSKGEISMWFEEFLGVVTCAVTKLSFDWPHRIIQQPKASMNMGMQHHVMIRWPVSILRARPARHERI